MQAHSTSIVIDMSPLLAISILAGVLGEDIWHGEGRLCECVWQGNWEGVSGPACLPPPPLFLRWSCTLNSWRKVAEGLLGGGAPKKGGGVAGPFTGAVV